VIDIELPITSYAQTALVDLDHDGRPEFVVAQQYRDILSKVWMPRPRTAVDSRMFMVFLENRGVRSSIYTGV
jgi:hypothetical protein